jgi:uncharacterized protein YkwD
VTWSLARPVRVLATALLLSVAVPLTGQVVHASASAATSGSTAASTAASTSVATSTVESQLLSLTNSARVHAGWPALTSSSALVAVARSWSSHMAATRQLTHDPSLATRVAGWSSLAENIAQAASAAQAQALFVGSPDHRANLLDAHFNRVGIGVARAADGSLWFTVDFEQTSGYVPPAAATSPVAHAAKKVSPRPPTRTSTALAARLAAANRANRSLVRGAVPTGVQPAAAVSAAARAEAAAVAAHAARLDAAELASSPAAAPGAALGEDPSAGGVQTTGLVLLGALLVLSVGGAVGAQTLVARRSVRRAAAG